MGKRKAMVSHSAGRQPSCPKIMREDLRYGGGGEEIWFSL